MAKNRNYFENVAKEINEAYQSWRTAFNADADIRPGADARAAAAGKKARAEQGQAFGALLMGARYDSKGKRIKGK
jgi:hypothetical protein